MKPDRTEVSKGYWLGEHFSNAGWDRFTLFREKRNSAGGSINWPLAEVDVVDHPPRDSCNRHTEIKISIRSDLKCYSGGIEVDKNRTELRHPEDILDTQVLFEVVAMLKQIGVASEPLSIYTCMRHVEDFRVEGDFWRED
jgi:hypothetical protein